MIISAGRTKRSGNDASTAAFHDMQPKDKRTAADPNNAKLKIEIEKR